MTLEQQVHQQELKIQKLEQRIRELEKNSHPPVDFIDRIVEAINSRELKLYVRNKNDILPRGEYNSHVQEAERFDAV